MVSKLPIALAAVQAQQDLAQQLEQARVINGRSIEAVARLLGIEVPAAEAALRGEHDLTLSELRMLAYAVGAVVEYQVESFAEVTS